MSSPIIVTVKVDKSDTQYDMELPTDVFGAELCGKLLIVLQSLDNETFSSVEKIKLRIDNSGLILGEEQTLDSVSVLEGNYVTLIKESR